MANKLGLPFACLFAILLSFALAPQLLANEVEPSAATTADLDECSAPDAGPTLAGGEAPPFAVEGLFADADRSNAAGCTAMEYCVHGGSVSCSAPSGTCQSSTQRCGRVTCNGQTTWCEGGCYAAYHCYYFCNESLDATCDDGCCSCD